MLFTLRVHVLADSSLCRDESRYCDEIVHENNCGQREATVYCKKSCGYCSEFDHSCSHPDYNVMLNFFVSRLQYRQRNGVHVCASGRHRFVGISGLVPPQRATVGAGRSDRVAVARSLRLQSSKHEVASPEPVQSVRSVCRRMVSSD